MNDKLTTVFIVMRRNGTYEDQRSIPIQSCPDRRDADHLANRMNQAAARLDGKLDGRAAMLHYWLSTHPQHVDPAVADRERCEEHARLSEILGIKADSEALGFPDDLAIDNPFWYVVEVPHGTPRPSSH